MSFKINEPATETLVDNFLGMKLDPTIPNSAVDGSILEWDAPTKQWILGTIPAGGSGTSINSFDANVDGVGTDAGTYATVQAAFTDNKTNILITATGMDLFSTLTHPGTDVHVTLTLLPSIDITFAMNAPGFDSKFSSVTFRGLGTHWSTLPPALTSWDLPFASYSLIGEQGMSLVRVSNSVTSLIGNGTRLSAHNIGWYAYPTSTRVVMTTELLGTNITDCFFFSGTTGKIAWVFEHTTTTVNSITNFYFVRNGNQYDRAELEFKCTNGASSSANSNLPTLLIKDCEFKGRVTIDSNSDSDYGHFSITGNAILAPILVKYKKMGYGRNVISGNAIESSIEIFVDSITSSSGDSLVITGNKLSGFKLTGYSANPGLLHNVCITGNVFNGIAYIEPFTGGDLTINMLSITGNVFDIFIISSNNNALNINRFSISSNSFDRYLYFRKGTGANQITKGTMNGNSTTEIKADVGVVLQDIAIVGNYVETAGTFIANDPGNRVLSGNTLNQVV